MHGLATNRLRSLLQYAQGSAPPGLEPDGLADMAMSCCTCSRSNEGNHDGVRPLQWHFCLPVQRGSRTAARAHPVLRDVRPWDDWHVRLLSFASHETAGLQGVRRRGTRHRPNSELERARRSPLVAFDFLVV